MTSPVTCEIAEGIATVTMDDGKVNALSPRMLEDLGAALDRAEAEGAAVVLSGREGVFSGGFDLRVFRDSPDEIVPMLEAGALLAERLLAFPRPVIAACTGNAIAMGAFLLLSTDLRIGVDADARIQINELQIGLTLPRFAVETLRQRLAPAHLQRAPLTAAPYSPREAQAAGFLDEIAAPQELAGTVRQRAAEMAGFDQDAFATSKRRLREPALAAVRAGIEQDARDWQGRFGGEA